MSTAHVHSPRLLFVTAGMGAGHNEAAAEIARRARASGATTWVLDLVDAAGTAGDRLVRTYRGLLDHAPWLYCAAMSFWRRWPAPLEKVTELGAGRFDTALTDAIDMFHPDVIVSTYNLASQALGRLASHDRAHAPVVTLLVDPGAHPYWVSPGVDLTLAPTAVSARALRDYGARRVAVVDPPLRKEFHAPPTRRAARDALGWPADSHIILINAGSWAVGHIDAALAAVARVPDSTAVVLCARDEGLRRRLGDRRSTIAVGWTPDIARYLAGADVVIDNAGGLTCWEALACGTPVLIYRPLPGHGRISAATLDRSGLARWVRGRRQLVSALRDNDCRPRHCRYDEVRPGTVRRADAPHGDPRQHDSRDPLTHVMALARRST